MQPIDELEKAYKDRQNRKMKLIGKLETALGVVEEAYDVPKFIEDIIKEAVAYIEEGDI